MRPLVSIIVVSYNSSEYIKETLDSIAIQTWPEIELIITDDCSKDNTIIICKEWLKENERRFDRVNILTVAKNTGVSANCNRGLFDSKGDWIKFISGDDTLQPSCIEQNLIFIKKNPAVLALFSYCRIYKEKIDDDCYLGLTPNKYPSNIITDDIMPDEQYRLLIVGNKIPFTPSFIAERKTLLKYGILDESLAFSDDYQRWLSLTKNGVKLYFLEKETVNYRFHMQSLSKQTIELIVNPVYFKTESSIRKLCYHQYPKDVRLSRIFVWYINHIFKVKYLNKKTRINLALHYLLCRVLNPFQYSIYIKSHWLKKYNDNIFYNSVKK